MGEQQMRQTGKTVSPVSNEGRNLYVVEHITNAVLKLMQTTHLNDISICQICDEAGVGRASFYRNFDSKEAVISKHLKSLLDSWWLKPFSPITGTTGNFALDYMNRGYLTSICKALKKPAVRNRNTKTLPHTLQRISLTAFSVGLKNGFIAVCRKRQKKWPLFGKNTIDNSGQYLMSSI